MSPLQVTVRLNRPCAEGHGLGGVGDVFVECRVTRARGCESQLETTGQIEGRQSDGATARAAGRPSKQAPPRVCPGFIRRDGRDVSLGRALFEVLVQEWPQDLLAEVERGVAVEFQNA